MNSRKPAPKRSSCPLNAALEVVGDRWALLIVRDILLRGFATYQEFAASDEGIASNILASRLKLLEDHDIIEKRPDPADGRRWIYRLSSKGLDLAPALVELILWGARYYKTSAPADAIERMTKDREGFIASLREQAREESDR